MSDAVRNNKKKETTMPDHSIPSAADVTTMAKVTGVAVGPDEAARIAAWIGPGLQGFAPVAGTLPFDLEPAQFVVVQNGSRP
jgi:hypothetical protein